MSDRSDRRRAERVPFSAQVTLRRNNASIVLEVSNISAGGILLRLDRGQMPKAALHEPVVVSFDAGPDAYGDPLDLEVDAEVVRMDHGGPDRPGGIALMWTSTDPAVPQRLALILDHLRER